LTFIMHQCNKTMRDIHSSPYHIMRAHTSECYRSTWCQSYAHTSGCDRSTWRQSYGAVRDLE
jgi:hypothetical protein